VGRPVVGQDLLVAGDPPVELGAPFALKGPELGALGLTGRQSLFAGLDAVGLTVKLGGLAVCLAHLGREAGQQLLEAPRALGQLGVWQLAQDLVVLVDVEGHLLGALAAERTLEALTHLGAVLAGDLEPELELGGGRLAGVDIEAAFLTVAREGGEPSSR